MMRSTALAVASWRRIMLLATVMMLLWSTVVLAKDTPDMSVSKFDHAPLNINYFEDSDVILFQDIEEQNVYRSDDAGASWKRVSNIPDGIAGFLIMHRFDSKTAFVLTAGLEHFKTSDRGKSWSKWDSLLYPSEWQTEILVFHADDPKRIIFNGMEYDGIFYSEGATYTTDGFESAHLLRPFTSGCWWAKSSPEFTTGDKDLDKNRIMCIVQDPLSFFKEEQRLFISDSFFKETDDERIDEFEPNLDMNKGVDGVVNLAVVKKYLLVATSSPMSDEMELFVSDDTLKWHRAMFPNDDEHDHSHKITQAAYTVLESTNYSIQIDVMTSHPSNPMGVLFTSNSNGTYFTENVPYTNRNHRGSVDFEKISGIQGVYLVNVVANGAETKKIGDNKVVSKITYDDGRTFESIKAGDDTIHLHSDTEMDNVGRVFSSPAPGLVMGNGNMGDSLNSFSKANLYVSDNAGLTWKEALKGPHKYEFGDSGSVLLAVQDTAKYDIEEYSYSLDHGENWVSVKFPGGIKIRPDLLTTTQDSTSLKFMLLGEEEEGPYHMISIDFDGLKKRKCGKDDMEDWHARVDEDGKPTCIMGHKQTYRRRKKSADCFIKDEFEDPVPKIENCECSDADFECDYNFQRDPEDNAVCKKAGPIARPEGSCKKEGEVFQGSSGWRLIPGNTCKRGSGKQKDDTVERQCSDAVSPPSSPGSGKVSKSEHVFDMEYDDFQKLYLVTGKFNEKEVVITRPVQQQADGRVKVEDKIWLSKDQGKKWEKILEGEKIRNIYPHKYFQDMVFFTTHDKKVIYSVDQGSSFHHFDAPTSPGDSFPLSFHPDMKDWLIWVGENCEDVGGKKSCYPQASISKDRGDNWTTLQRYVKRCEFTGRSDYKFRSSTQIVCLAMKEEREDAPLTVVTSDDFFDKDKTMFDGEVTNFATMSEFILLANEERETGELYAFSSLDGKNFVQAHFPSNFHLGNGTEYTVLDSSTHAINLFVLTSGAEDREYGAVLKSNSNGTSYVVSAPNVNSNALTYVDFEKVAGLEGVALINAVANKDDKSAKKKHLQTRISHNDGSEWGFLPPPAKDVDGKSYSCRSDKGDASCALHLHHYTERSDRDKDKTFAASTAVGLILGIGNVGSSLGGIEDADTFLSTDGGILWKNVKKGHWTWQYGDQGSIIVLVQTATRKNPVKTRHVSYSLDQGETWENYDFADSDVTVTDITTVQSGMSRNFLLWCKSDKGKKFTVNLDFSGFADEPCKKTDGSDSDYFLWSPKHPLQGDDCLFGHVATYLRKKPGSKCYNDENLQRLQSFKPCECSRRDYEW